MGKLMMSRKEREQLRVFSKLKAGEITQVAAGIMLKMTPRWIRRKLKRYVANGDAGLLHQGRGKPSKKRWDDASKEIAINLLKDKWSGFGPTFAAAKLKELHKISVSDETLRHMMIKEGLWQKKRKRSGHRMRRVRRAMLGMLIQLDGSPHDWFEGRGPRCTLLVFIDDATSKIVWLQFVPSESVESLMKATQAYIDHHGRPHAFYVDFGGVFSVNTNNHDRDKLTQWERACKELAIDVIHATSPQAKGRVERCNKTLQDRLVKEMRLANISSIEQANLFAQETFIAEHNKHFALLPAQEGDAHRPVEDFDLKRTFCIKEQRVIQNDFVVAYKNQLFQITKLQNAVPRPKEKVDVYDYFSGPIELFIRGIKLNTIRIDARPSKTVKCSIPRSFHRPAFDHPWRRSFSNNLRFLLHKESRVKMPGRRGLHP